MDEERHLIVDGRRWRRSDPSIPEPLRAELVAELMAARRSVGAALRSGDGDAEQSARRRVHDAKLALGERGRAWWEPSLEFDSTRAAAAMRTLLRHRDGGTICPSDVARAVGGERWRDAMADVDALAKSHARDGHLRMLQRGEEVADLDAVTGPIRLALPPAP